MVLYSSLCLDVATIQKALTNFLIIMKLLKDYDCQGLVSWHFSDTGVNFCVNATFAWCANCTLKNLAIFLSITQLHFHLFGVEISFNHLLDVGHSIIFSRQIYKLVVVSLKSINAINYVLMLYMMPKSYGAYGY